MAAVEVSQYFGIFRWSEFPLFLEQTPFALCFLHSPVDVCSGLVFKLMYIDLLI